MELLVNHLIKYVELSVIIIINLTVFNYDKYSCFGTDILVEKIF